ncbi:unnamed protein product, partial [Allacma fusca]
MENSVQEKFNAIDQRLNNLERQRHDMGPNELNENNEEHRGPIRNVPDIQRGSYDQYGSFHGKHWQGNSKQGNRQGSDNDKNWRSDNNNNFRNRNNRENSPHPNKDRYDQSRSINRENPRNDSSQRESSQERNNKSDNTGRASSSREQSSERSNRHDDWTNNRSNSRSASRESSASRSVRFNEGNGPHLNGSVDTEAIEIENDSDGIFYVNDFIREVKDRQLKEDKTEYLAMIQAMVDKVPTDDYLKDKLYAVFEKHQEIISSKPG